MGRRNPQYPPGYVRKGYPVVYGWAEFVAASGRTDYGLRSLRETHVDFPEPVWVISSGPAYLKTEADAWLARNPKGGMKGLSKATVERMFKLKSAGVSTPDIAEVLDLHVNTVYRYLRGGGTTQLED